MIGNLGVSLLFETPSHHFMSLHDLKVRETQLRFGKKVKSLSLNSSLPSEIIQGAIQDGYQSSFNKGVPQGSSLGPLSFINE